MQPLSLRIVDKVRSAHVLVVTLAGRALATRGVQQAVYALALLWLRDQPTRGRDGIAAVAVAKPEVASLWCPMNTVP